MNAKRTALSQLHTRDGGQAFRGLEKTMYTFYHITDQNWEDGRAVFPAEAIRLNSFVKPSTSIGIYASDEHNARDIWFDQLCRTEGRYTKGYIYEICCVDFEDVTTNVPEFFVTSEFVVVRKVEAFNALGRRNEYGELEYVRLESTKRKEVNTMLTKRQLFALQLRDLAWKVGRVHWYYGPVPRKYITLDVFGIRRLISKLLYIPSQSDRFMQASWVEIVGNDNVNLYGRHK